MANESIHDKLSRVRKPHVHISYKVETGGAMEVKELPFVMGLLGDYAGDTKLEPLKKREFTDIDRDNFNQVMSKISPSLNIRVENTLAGDGSEMALALKFNELEDFSPGKVVAQVPALQKLLEARNKLRDLASTVDRIEGGEEMLAEILKDAEKVKNLAGGAETPKT